MSSLFFPTIIVFVLTYALIISEKIHRVVVVFIGAMLLIFLGVLTQEQAIAGIDFNTIGLLIGMMIVVGVAKDSGIFQYIALWASKAGKGDPVKIFLLLGIITALFSAFLDNVTTIVLMLPIAFVIANNLKINAKVFVIELILLSNIGGMTTLIGDPPNILIGSAARLTFNDFILNLFPIGILVAAATLCMLFFWYKKQLVTTPSARASIMRFNPSEALSDKTLLIKSLFVFCLILIGFLTHGASGLETATIALSGAGLLLLLTMKDPENHLRDIEWTSIFFFVGLFILVAGLQSVGAIRLMAGALLNLTGNSTSITAIVILWGSAVISAFVDNIPFVATMIPLVKEFGALSGMNLAPLWWALALGADIGGNATLIGASANVVASGMFKKEGGNLSFCEYMKVASLITFVGLVLCTAYLYIRYL